MKRSLLALLLAGCICLAGCTPVPAAPFSIFPQGPDGQQNMGVGIASPFIMNGEIGAHPSIHKIVFDESPDKRQLLRW